MPFSAGFSSSLVPGWKSILDQTFNNDDGDYAKPFIIVIQWYGDNDCMVMIQWWYGDGDTYRDLGSSYCPGPAAMRAGVCPKPYLSISIFVIRQVDPMCLSIFFTHGDQSSSHSKIGRKFHLRKYFIFILQVVPFFSYFIYWHYWKLLGIFYTKILMKSWFMTWFHEWN